MEETVLLLVRKLDVVIRERCHKGILGTSERDVGGAGNPHRRMKQTMWTRDCVATLKQRLGYGF